MAARHLSPALLKKFSVLQTQFIRPLPLTIRRKTVSLNVSTELFQIRYIRPDHTNWDAILPFVTFAYNTAVQKTTGYSLFLLVYGRDPSFMLDASVLSASVYSSSPLHEFISRLNYCRRLASLNTAASQRDRKDRYDASHRTVLFRPGDEVLLWTPTRKPGLCEKFLHPFTGPYTILEETSPVNYHVTPCSAPRDRRYHGTEIVHVSRLKPFMRRSS
ncbi:uncharacterized protein LOC144143418 [Haemaphysalis longicornis]